MKCPHCNSDVSDMVTLAYIQNNEKFRKKVASLLGRIGGQSNTLTPEQRSDRAANAAKKRWHKKETP